MAKTEREQLDDMSDHELASYWNVMQCPCIRGSLEKHNRHLAIVGDLLTDRSIPHELGKRIETVSA